MRAHEFISEGTKGSVPKRHNKSQPGAYKFMDNGTDRTYHLNQITKAVAMADGSSTKALQMNDESFVGKNNVAYPYSELEHNMMMQAFNTVSPTNAQKMIPSNRSTELDSVNKSSPIKPRKDYRKK